MFLGNENSEIGADGLVHDDKDVEVQSVLALPVGRSCECDVAPESTLSGACKMVAVRLRASPEPLRSDPFFLKIALFPLCCTV